MKNMIRASFYKLFHDKATWIGLAGTAVWSLCVGLALTWISDGKQNLGDVYALEKYWRDFMGYHAIMIPLLLSAVSLFTMEFKDKSWKLFVARGISKTSFYFSKVLCILLVTVMNCCVGILTGAIFAAAVLGMPVNMTIAVLVLKYLLLQVIAHCTAAILVLAISFVLMNSEVASSLNMILFVFGTMALSKIEAALGFGDMLTGSWAFAQPLQISFLGTSDVLRLMLVLVGYLVVCSLAVILFTANRDIE